MGHRCHQDGREVIEGIVTIVRFCGRRYAARTSQNRPFWFLASPIRIPQSEIRNGEEEDPLPPLKNGSVEKDTMSSGWVTPVSGSEVGVTE